MKRQKVRNDEYMYKRVSGKDSDDEGEETELFSIKKGSSPFKEIPTVEKTIQEGDTLQSLSIRYLCSISELKRLNNIHKENEIFARNTIKVPARPFSMAIAGVHDSGNSSPNGKITLPEMDSNLLEHKLTNYSKSDSTDLNSVIFNSNIVSKTNDFTLTEELSQNTNEEEVCLIPNEPIPEEPIPSRFSCNGVDADISWIALIVCIIVVIFAIPVLYVVYIYEHPKDFQHKHEHS